MAAAVTLLVLVAIACFVGAAVMGAVTGEAAPRKRTVSRLNGLDRMKYGI